MSSVVVLAPVVVASWPVITAAVTAAIGTLGYSIVKQPSRQKTRQENVTRTELELEESEILEGAAGTGEELVVEREGVRAIFTRDARGALKVCMEGSGLSKKELKRLGEEMIGRVTQQYVYHKVVTELKQRNMQIVDEEAGADRTIKIRVRNW
jgi:hypothetical protein